MVALLSSSSYLAEINNPPLNEMVKADLRKFIREHQSNPKMKVQVMEARYELGLRDPREPSC